MKRINTFTCNECEENQDVYPVLKCITMCMLTKSIKIPYSCTSRVSRYLTWVPPYRFQVPVKVSRYSTRTINSRSYVQGRLEADEALLGHHWHQILKDHEVVSLGTGPCGAVLSPAPIPALQENQYNMTNKFSNFPKNNNLPVRPED
jgi:hypothetical protein